MYVWNIRLNWRGGESGPPSLGQIRSKRAIDPGIGEVGHGQLLGAGQLVEPVAAMAGGAFDQRIGERADVARRDPDLGMHQDAGVQADDVVALLDHRPPPGPLDVVLELDAERAVVPHGVDAAVDLRAREDEAAPLRERHDRVEARRSTGATSFGSDAVARSAVSGGLGHLASLAEPQAGRPDPDRVGVVARERFGRPAVARDQAGVLGHVGRDRRQRAARRARSGPRPRRSRSRRPGRRC